MGIRVLKALHHQKKYKMIRIFDFLISFIALVVFSPLFLIIMVILKFTGENEVFYLQKRVGKNGKEFVLKNYNYTNITKSLITTINSIK